MNIQSIFRYLSETDYDSLFFRAKDKLPIPFQNLFPPQPTALVHPGPTLLQHPYGPDIDTFPTIIRFLPFRISSYEAFTGKKTSLWVTDQLQEEKITWDRNNGFFLPLFITGHFLPFEKKQALLQTQYGDSILSQSIIFHNNELLKFIRTTLNFIPSSNLILLLLLSLRYKNITLFGFDPSATLTYFVVPKIPHPPKETSIIRTLSSKKIIQERHKATTNK